MNGSSPKKSPAVQLQSAWILKCMSEGNPRQSVSHRLCLATSTVCRKVASAVLISIRTNHLIMAGCLIFQAAEEKKKTALVKEQLNAVPVGAVSQLKTPLVSIAVVVLVGI